MSNKPSRIPGKSAIVLFNNMFGLLYHITDLVWVECTSHWSIPPQRPVHYIDVMMSAIAFQFTSLTIVCSTVYSDAECRRLLVYQHWWGKWPPGALNVTCIWNRDLGWNNVGQVRVDLQLITWHHVSVIASETTRNSIIKLCIPGSLSGNPSWPDNRFTKDQKCGKRFHVIASSCIKIFRGRRSNLMIWW